MATKLETLIKQAEDIQKAIKAETERQKRIAEGGGGFVDLDLEEVERRLDAIIINGANSVKLLERLNQVGDNTYAKLEAMSLQLLEVMALGMPLLRSAGR